MNNYNNVQKLNNDSTAETLFDTLSDIDTQTIQLDDEYNIHCDSNIFAADRDNCTIDHLSSRDIEEHQNLDIHQQVDDEFINSNDLENQNSNYIKEQIKFSKNIETILFFPILTRLKLNYIYCIKNVVHQFIFLMKHLNG